MVNFKDSRIRANILFNANITPSLKNNPNGKDPKILMDALTKIKQTSQEDFHKFLQSDHRDFNVFSVSFKQILSTQRIHIILSKNSAKSFYLKDKSKVKETKPVEPKSTLP